MKCAHQLQCAHEPLVIGVFIALDFLTLVLAKFGLWRDRVVQWQGARSARANVPSCAWHGLTVCAIVGRLDANDAGGSHG